MSNFEIDLKTGTKGEVLAFEYLKSLSYVQSIQDVSKDKHFQKLDVDFIVEDIKGGKMWVEVKYDSFTDGCQELNIKATHNICFEISSNGNVGCLARSRADMICYITTKYIYMFKLNDVKKFINDNKPPLRDMGDGAKGYLLNVDNLLNNKLMYIAKER